MIDQMRRYSSIDEHLEKMLLERLGSEPYPHTYTEQDLHEQSRKMIMQYNRNHTGQRTTGSCRSLTELLNTSRIQEAKN
jgi:hypothetical protein